MYELLKEFIRPEVLVLVPVLYLLGAALKRSSAPDKLIPWVLGSVGVVLTLLYVAATCSFPGWQSVLLGVFTAVVQGVLAAGASVYVNQIVKQSGKEN